MKTHNRYLVKPSKIHSLKDIELEKQRLRLEILKKEQDIHEGYRDILHALSPRNIASSLVNDVATSSTIVSKAFSVGKAFLSKRKKKKHDRLKAESQRDAEM
jgi:hypothetical protein